MQKKCDFSLKSHFKEGYKDYDLFIESGNSLSFFAESIT